MRQISKAPTLIRLTSKAPNSSSVRSSKVPTSWICEPRRRLPWRMQPRRRLPSGARHLKGANLILPNLEGATFAGANINGADLSGANLPGAYLDGANLEGANLHGAHLDGAVLSGAKLEGANLEGADLSGANLEGSNLKNSRLAYTSLHNVTYAPASPPPDALSRRHRVVSQPSSSAHGKQSGLVQLRELLQRQGCGTSNAKPHSPLSITRRATRREWFPRRAFRRLAAVDFLRVDNWLGPIPSPSIGYHAWADGWNDGRLHPADCSSPYDYVLPTNTVSFRIWPTDRVEPPSKTRKGWQRTLASRTINRQTCPAVFAWAFHFSVLVRLPHRLAGPQCRHMDNEDTANRVRPSWSRLGPYYLRAPVTRQRLPRGDVGLDVLRAAFSVM